MRRWIEDVLEEPVEWGAEDSDSPGSGFADGLMDGEILCKYDILQSANADEFKVVASLQLKNYFSGGEKKRPEIRRETILKFVMQ